MNFSYSKINTFKNCPYKFKRVYIDGEKEESYYFDLGSISHKMCELYLEEKITEEILNKKLYELCYDSKFDTEQLMADGKTIINYDTFALLKKIFKNYTKRKRNYSTEGWLKKEDFLKKHTYIGRYDVLIKELPEKIVIVDFKTSKKWKGVYHPDWEQLYMYAYLLYDKMMKEKEEIPHKIQVVLWFLRSNDMFVEEIKEIDMVNALKSAEDTSEKILKAVDEGNFKPKKNNFCKVCKFREDCGL